MNEKQLKDRAHEASELMERGRMLLVAAIREAYQEGMSQRQIAAAIGKSQPEVNRLIRFHGSTPHAVSLRRARKQVVDILESEGLSAPRVFGSTASGQDSDESDIDLLVKAKKPLGLFKQSRIERALSGVIGVEVDLVLEDSIRADLKDRILKEAVPL